MKYGNNVPIVYQSDYGLRQELHRELRYGLHEGLRQTKTWTMLPFNTLQQNRFGEGGR